MNIWYLSTRNMKRQSSHSIRCIIAISVSLLVVTWLFGIIAGMEADLVYNITHYSSGDVRIRNKEFSKNILINPAYLTIKNEQKITAALSSFSEVTNVSRRLILPGSVIKNDRIERFTLYGVDLETEAAYQNWKDLSIEGRVPQPGKREVLLGKKVAQRLGLQLGNTVTLFGTTRYRSSNAMSFEVAGIIDYPVASYSSELSFISLDLAQRFFKSPNELTEINIRVKNPRERMEFSEELRQLLQKETAQELDIEALDQTKMLDMIKFTRLIYLNIAAIFFLLGGLVIFNTINATLLERRFEFAVMMAMGFTKKMLHKSVWLEYSLISLIGVFVGMILGNCIVIIMSNTGLDMSFKGFDSEGMGFSTILYPQISAFWTILVMIYGFIVVNILIWLPLRKIRKINITETLARGG